MTTGCRTCANSVFLLVMLPFCSAAPPKVLSTMLSPPGLASERMTCIASQIAFLFLLVLREVTCSGPWHGETSKPRPCMPRQRRRPDLLSRKVRQISHAWVHLPGLSLELLRPWSSCWCRSKGTSCRANSSKPRALTAVVLHLL